LFAEFGSAGGENVSLLPPRTGTAASPATAVFTVPNLLSFSRLLGVPLFLWLLLGPHADGWALAVLMVSGITDWADGVLARRLDQIPRSTGSTFWRPWSGWCCGT